MEERIETRVPPQQVWDVWERAHASRGEGGIVEGQAGRSQQNQSKGFRYQIVDVVPGERFSILWRTLFVRLFFSHSVVRTERGSAILYRVQIKGLFAWPIRLVLGNKIRRNIRAVLQAMVRQLEQTHLK